MRSSPRASAPPPRRRVRCCGAAVPPPTGPTSTPSRRGHVGRWEWSGTPGRASLQLLDALDQVEHLGPKAATIRATPSAFGWMPSGCMKARQRRRGSPCSAAPAKKLGQVAACRIPPPVRDRSRRRPPCSPARNCPAPAARPAAPGTSCASAASRMPVEVRARDRRVDPAQQVVAAQRHDHRVDLRRQRPVDPRQPARRGVAGDAGVDQLDIRAVLVQPGLQLRHEALAPAGSP